MIASPTITFTDYAIALESVCFAGWLLRSGWVERTWAVAFAGTGLAAGLGGTAHGFVNQLPLGIQLWLWQGVAMGLAIAAGAMILATTWDTLKGAPRRWMEAIALGKLGVNLPLALIHMSFIWSVIDYLMSMVIIVGLRWSSPTIAARWTHIGVGLSAIALLPLVVFNVWQVGPVWIRPEVQYHVIQMVALYSFFQAACSTRQKF